MTTPNSTEGAGGADAGSAEGSDQQPVGFDYGHGRMPFFMKLVWLGFLAFGAFYVAYYLLSALAVELD